MMPGILSQMGADNLQSLRRLAEQMPNEGRGPGGPALTAAEDDDDDGEPWLHLRKWPTVQWFFQAGGGC